MAKPPLKELHPLGPSATAPTYRPPLRQQALTWQQIAAILVGLAAGFAAIFAFGAGRDLDPYRGPWTVAFVACVAACVGLAVLHIRSTRRRDLQPDILAQTVPIESIFELGKCHVYFASRTYGPAVEISGYVQNQTDAPGALEMNFNHASRQGTAALPIPPLVVQVPTAALVAFRGLFPCVGPSTPTQYKVFLKGRFAGGGKRVRFGRRRHLTKKVSTGTTAALLASGVLYTGGGVSFTFTAAGSPPDAISPRTSTAGTPRSHGIQIKTNVNPREPDALPVAQASGCCGGTPVGVAGCG